jgi:hypothetical protein
VALFLLIRLFESPHQALTTDVSTCGTATCRMERTAEALLFGRVAAFALLLYYGVSSASRSIGHCGGVIQLCTMEGVNAE